LKKRNYIENHEKIQEKNFWKVCTKLSPNIGSTKGLDVEDMKKGKKMWGFSYVLRQYWGFFQVP